MRVFETFSKYVWDLSRANDLSISPNPQPTSIDVQNIENIYRNHCIICKISVEDEKKNPRTQFPLQIFHHHFHIHPLSVGQQNVYELTKFFHRLQAYSKIVSISYFVIYVCLEKQVTKYEQSLKPHSRPSNYVKTLRL